MNAVMTVVTLFSLCLKFLPLFVVFAQKCCAWRIYFECGNVMQSWLIDSLPSPSELPSVQLKTSDAFIQGKPSTTTPAIITDAQVFCHNLLLFRACINPPLLPTSINIQLRCIARPYFSVIPRYFLLKARPIASFVSFWPHVAQTIRCKIIAAYFPILRLGTYARVRWVFWNPNSWTCKALQNSCAHTK